ncbi:hypothetical protein A8926_3140 [Saccharopolyspora spinosa]|uniref:Uncharacterized protein n=1 Tax=Saccharopolyspora spinosa TaxID=60894 RepID=A0A2N3XXP1_SACSN|nr:hypothetical protein A8926_3140 [Saccharopolyspora spinosa]
MSGWQSFPPGIHLWGLGSPVIQRRFCPGCEDYGASHAVQGPRRVDEANGPVVSSIGVNGPFTSGLRARAALGALVVTAIPA